MARIGALGKEARELLDIDRSHPEKTIRRHRVEENHGRRWRVVHEHTDEAPAKRRPPAEVVALWVDAGENLKSVSVRAEHSSVAFTQDRYGHLYENREPEIQDRLDALLDARHVSETPPENVVDLRDKRENTA